VIITNSKIHRKRNEWDLFEPVVDLLTNEEVEAVEAREERNARYGSKRSKFMQVVLDQKLILGYNY
jgi:SWI/SNF-related matrix-associated actin-dependent regulator of chromatin subfamily B protein 1